MTRNYRKRMFNCEACRQQRPARKMHNQRVCQWCWKRGLETPADLYRYQRGGSIW